MDKRFLYSNFVDSDSKLTRAASLSELSASKKFVEQQYRSETCGNLVKQFSSERIFEQQAQESHINEVQISRSDNEQQANNSNTRGPSFIVLPSVANSRWLGNEHESSGLQKQLSLPAQYHSFRGVQNMDSKKIIALPKLMNKDSKSNLCNIINNNNSDFGQRTDKTLLSDSIFKLNNTSLSDKIKNIGNNVELVHKKDFIEDIKENFNFENQNNQPIELEKVIQKEKRFSQLGRKNAIYRYLCSSKLSFILLPILVAFLVKILTNSTLFDDICNPRFNLNKVSEELKNHIFGQDEAIDILNKHFTEIHNQTGLDVIILVGGIGVGKSYTTEIIKNTLKDTVKLKNLDLFPPLYNKEDKAYVSLSVCRCNLIRLENLKTDDVLDALHFIKNLRTKFPNYCILIVALFNTEEIDYNLKRSMDLDKSVIMIRQHFEKINLQTTIVKFQSMNNEALIECIKDAAKHANVNLSNNEIDFVMEDLIAANSGCKGAYAKVQIVGKKIRKSSK